MKRRRQPLILAVIAVVAEWEASRAKYTRIKTDELEKCLRRLAIALDQYIEERDGQREARKV